MGGASRKWIKSLIPRKKQRPTDHQEDGKKKGGLWRSMSEGSMLSEKMIMKRTYLGTSEASESATYALNDPALAAAMATIIRAPPKDFAAIKREWAAIRIQTLFRAFLARHALRALKAIVRIQSIFRGQQVRKQADVTLKCMQALVRVQARVRAQSMATLEGDEVGSLFGKKPDSTNPIKQAEQGWCDSPGTLEDVMAKLEERLKGVLKRERAMVYSLPRQHARASPSPTTRTGMPANSMRNDGPDKGNVGGSWWQNRLVDKSCYFDTDLAKVRRNNLTTRVSVTSSFSNPISESLYSESSSSTSSASASLTPISRILTGERTEESKIQTPSYMNLTESAKAKQAGRFLCQELLSKQAIADVQFHTKSMMLSAREARSISWSTPPVNFSKDLYPPAEFDRRGWFKEASLM